MSVLSGLLGNYSDDIANVAINNLDNVAVAASNNNADDMIVAAVKKAQQSDNKYAKLLKKAKNYKSLGRFEKMNNPIKGSEIWGDKPTSIFQRDSRAVRVNMFPNDATKGTGLTKQYLLNILKDAHDQGITNIVPSYGIYTKEGESFMNHLAEQGWLKSTGRNGVASFEIAPKIAEWSKTNPLADIYNAAHGDENMLKKFLG